MLGIFISNFSLFYRHGFSKDVAVSETDATLLKACSNPPEPQGKAVTEEVKTIEIIPEMMFETTRFERGSAGIDVEFVYFYLRNTTTPS